MRRTIKDFIGKPAPPGYVAGVGRGATGFTTRSDIGPAREMPAPSMTDNEGAGPSAAKRMATSARRDDDGEDEYFNDNNFDEFAGYGGSLFNKDPYEEDDEEADKIYEQIDQHLDERGKALRETKTRQELQNFRKSTPKIQQQFSDLKAGLKQVSEEEWMKIPDVGDARNRKQRAARQDKLTPVPDSLLAHRAKLASGGDKVVYIEPIAEDDEDGGEGSGNDETDRETKAMSVSLANDSAKLNIDEMSEFRSSYMSMKLSRVSNDLDSSQATANPQDYLTNLQSMVPKQITDASTLAEYRKQFAALRATNPTFQNAWIASVRLEEAAGKLKQARSLILAGCEQCPKSADLWCEAIRLHPADVAKALMVKALKENPRSVKLWLKAADLEQDDEAKRRVFSKAREIVPKAALIWKRSVDLEPPNEARRILSEAVECCPNEVDLWIALAKQQPYEEAQRTLIKASERNPTERRIWITAAKLQEEAGNKSLVGAIIKRAVEQLSEKGIEIKRTDWLNEAVDADKANYKLTCRELIKRIIGWNIGTMNNDDRLKLWLEDARRFADDRSFNCARAVYESIVNDKQYSKLESVWSDYVEFERQFGTCESLSELLRRSVERDHCPKSETLWLQLAHEQRFNLDESRQILSDALDANPDSERVVLAAVELECDNPMDNYKEARRILADACKSARTPQLVMRSARLEWSLGNVGKAEELLEAGLADYKDCADFYLTLGQIKEERAAREHQHQHQRQYSSNTNNNKDSDASATEPLKQAKELYSTGLKFQPTSVELWIRLASLEERTENPKVAPVQRVARARALLEKARLRNPRVPLLYLESARLELRNIGRGGRENIAREILTKGCRECRGQQGLNELTSKLDELNKSAKHHSGSSSSIKTEIKKE